MSNISANSLFHFTCTKENLISIINNGFYPRYSYETFIYVEDTHSLGMSIPMVSFCDIPLSQIKNHVRQYGNYAVGLSKEWAKKKTICPVLYTHSSASLASNIFSSFKTIEKINKENNNQNVISEVDEVFKAIAYSLCFMKPYEGKLVKDGTYKGEIIRFYDEREWRYMPSPDDFERCKIKLLKYDELGKTEILNRQLQLQLILPFEPNDVRYIIVDKESEIIEVMNIINDAFGQKFFDDDVRLLITRILSIERIKDDF